MNTLDEFEWDPAKAAANEAKHGVSFEFATRVFRDRARADWNVSRSQDNEARYKSVGLIGNRFYTVVHTPRGNVCRIISARRSNPQEERRYVHR